MSALNEDKNNLAKLHSYLATQIGHIKPSIGASVMCTHEIWHHLPQTAHPIQASLCPGLLHPSISQSVLCAGGTLLASSSWLRTYNLMFMAQSLFNASKLLPQARAIAF